MYNGNNFIKDIFARSTGQETTTEYIGQVPGVGPVYKSRFAVHLMVNSMNEKLAGGGLACYGNGSCISATTPEKAIETYNSLNPGYETEKTFKPA